MLKCGGHEAIHGIERENSSDQNSLFFSAVSAPGYPPLLSRSELRQEPIHAGDFLFSVSFPSSKDNLCRKRGGRLDRASLTTDKRDSSIRLSGVATPRQFSLLAAQTFPINSPLPGSLGFKLKGLVYCLSFERVIKTTTPKN
jgi:hypothetical protein